MQIFYNPEDGQVMAVYSGRYTGTVWQSRGYLAAESSIPLTRDHRVTVSGGKVVSAEERVNSEQPEPSIDELAAAARQAILDELLEARVGQADAPQAVKDYAARRPR